MVTEGEKGTNIEMSYNGEERELDSPTDSLVTDFDVTYIPEGYNFISKTISTMDIVYEFITNDEETITITKMSPDAAGVILFNKGDDITYETIDGCEAMVSENKKDKRVIITWSNDEEMCYNEVVAYGITREEALKVANGLKNIEE